MTSLCRRAVVLIGAVALLAACSGDPDPTVQFEMQAAPFQPWVATGELVDAGELCPKGTRENVGLAHPDESPMAIEEFVAHVEEGEQAGASMRDIFRESWFIGWEEYICDDGSGTFTIMEESGENGQGEVVEGTGAYLGMTGDCAANKEFDSNDELVSVTTNCTFELSSSGG